MPALVSESGPLVVPGGFILRIQLNCPIISQDGFLVPAQEGERVGFVEPENRALWVYLDCLITGQDGLVLPTPSPMLFQAWL